MDHSILNCDQAIPYLKPSLKTSEEAIKVALDDLPVLRKLGYDLLVSYLVDMGDRFQYIQGRHLKSSGLTEEELHAHSIKNLKSLMKAKLEIKPYGPVFAVFLNGNCESSVLLADDLWDEKLADLTPNGSIAAVPARDVLAFCDASSQEGISELRALVKRIENGDHLITPILFRRTEKSWVRYAD